MSARVFLLLSGLAIGAALWQGRAAVKVHWSRFWNYRAHPLNLAVFRILLFWVLLQNGSYRLGIFLDIPEGLRILPPGWEPWLRDLPLDHAFAWKMQVCFRTAALLACAGLFTRWTAWIAVITGIYVLGIPQFFGKINHTHHLLWFAAILASSRCGDVLSLDWLLRRLTLGRPDHAPHTVYGRPLCYLWILFGLIYFFPGFWKLWAVGWDWIFSDNLVNMMHRLWLQHGVLPPFRIDHFPLLCHMAAAFVITFELSVIFLAFFPPLHPFIIAGGLAFHESAGAFMNIRFELLTICYVAFVDWYRLFTKIPGFRSLEFFLTRSAQRIPVLRLPMESLFRPYFSLPAADAAERQPALRLTGALLIAAALICGFTRFDTWPFGLYPTFAYREGAFLKKIVIEGEDAAGITRAVSEKKLLRNLHSARWRGMQQRIRWAPPQRKEALYRELIRFAAFKDPSLRKAGIIRIYEESVWLSPERQSENPYRRELLYETHDTSLLENKK